MRYLFLLSCLIGAPVIATQPAVEIVYHGWLGNNLWQYCIGRIIAEELGYKCVCQPLYGFPETYDCWEDIRSPEYSTQHIKSEGADANLINMRIIIEEKDRRNIKLEGFFQQYQYLKPYKKKIREKWLRIEPTLRALFPTRDPGDIVVHIRCGEFGAVFPASVPFEYYEKALSMAHYERVFICTDEPEHPFVKKLAERYRATIHSNKSLTTLLRQGYDRAALAKANFDDFLYMLSFDQAILSYSTLAWWIGFLSKARIIYMPLPDARSRYPFDFGEPIEESRYCYISTPVGGS